MAIKGIDVSKWQGTIDWGKVAASRVEFAMIRCGVGSSSGKVTADSMFAANLKGAVEAGISVGVYLYAYSKDASAARTEAENVVSMLATSGSLISYPVCWDVEDKNQLGLSRSEIFDMACAWRDVIERAGFIPGIYTSTSWLNARVTIPDGCDLWLAHWKSVSSPSSECPNPASAIWQHTDKGRVPGIDGYVDLDWCYKDYPAKVPERAPVIPADVDDAIDYLANSGKMNSPELWREIICGKRTANINQIGPMLVKWADAVRDGRYLVSDMMELINRFDK